MRSFIVALMLSLGASTLWADENSNMRTFLFISTPKSAAWEMQIAKPGDRAASVRGGIEALGGEFLSYYWGLGNGKNYLTVSLPDDLTFIQAVYGTRPGDGLLDDYQMIELISSADMATALARGPDVKAVDDLK